MKPDNFHLTVAGEDGKLIRKEARRRDMPCAHLIREWVELKLAELVRRESEAIESEQEMY